MYVYDIEVFQNLHTAYFLNVDTKEEHYFVVHPEYNQFREYAEFLFKLEAKKTPLIGFNNANYDGRILDYILDKIVDFKLIYKSNTTYITQSIYQRSQDIINNEKRSFREHRIPQIDLYLINHYDNENRRCSLKWLEFTMGFQNVEDMPFKYYEKIEAVDIPNIVAYNANDVRATYELYLRTIPAIALRRSFIDKYQLPCLNWSDAKIGIELVMKFYIEETGIPKWQIKQKIARPEKVVLQEIIRHDLIKLNSKVLKDVYTFFNNCVVYTQQENKLNKTIHAYNMEIVYALGGVHGCTKPGIYKSDDEWIIIDADVASLYPSIAVILGLYPKHLGPEFFKIYKEKIVDVRLAEKAKPKKERDNDLIGALKLSANSVYGKSNEYTSLLYDPTYTYATTINGQLLLSMLLERLYSIPGILPLQINTDGVTVKIQRKYVDIYYNICKQWMAETGFELEYVEYSSMIIRDVNNYLAIKLDGEIKDKGGAFIKNPDLHKDTSCRVVKIALQDYYAKGIPVENTILSHKNIYDFLIGNKKKSNTDYSFYEYDTDGRKEIDSKVIRYIISKSGKSLIKIYSDGRMESLQKGYYAQLLNKIEDSNAKNYNINYQYYIRECNKVIDAISPIESLTLF